MRRVRVQVFARDPEPGRTKTRLIPALGADGACRCYLCLLDATLATALDADVGAVELWSDRVPESDALALRAARCGTPLRVQSGGDLGARMAHALEDALAEGVLPMLVGSDLPGLETRHLQQGAAALRAGAPAVFAAAEDGGYGLVGLSRPWRGLFRDIPWGSDQVMHITRARAGEIPLTELGQVWDVDAPADLIRLQGLTGFEACHVESDS